MIFLKRQLPLIICFTVGVAMALQYFVPTTFSQKVSATAADWYIIIAIFASFLGFGSVAIVHWRKVSTKQKGWAYSAVMFAGIFAMVIAGLLSRGKQASERWPFEKGEAAPPEEVKNAQGVLVKRTEKTLRRQSDADKKAGKAPFAPVLVRELEFAPDGKITSAKETVQDREGKTLEVRKLEIDENGKLVPTEGVVTPLGWLYNNTLAPLQGTMFAMLGFYVASAAFRSFRAKSLEAGVLLVTALVVLVGNVPFSNYIWADVFGVQHVQGIKLQMTDIVDWIMNVPNTAARRGVGFGVALGGIATALKVIFGIERAYLGGGD